MKYGPPSVSRHARTVSPASRANTNNNMKYRFIGASAASFVGRSTIYSFTIIACLSNRDTTGSSLSRKKSSIAFFTPFTKG